MGGKGKEVVIFPVPLKPRSPKHTKPHEDKLLA